MLPVKVCGILSKAEAELAHRAGASHLGLVSAMPSGSGLLTEDEIAAIVAVSPPGANTVLLTSAREAGRILQQLEITRAHTVQLCDRLAPEARESIRRQRPGVAVMQVVHVWGEESLAEARDAARFSDLLLLDSGRPDDARRTLGGTGDTHDWSISARIVERAPCPVFLAGGLNAGNVADAVRAVRPYGVDLYSGVRTDGLLDQAKVDAFFAAVAEVRAELG
ncbi:MAG: phosphoribosylanthranilate isomerase [Planctomycetota bacterium]